MYDVRIGLLGHKTVVILVEEEYDDGPDDWRGMPEYLAGKHWREATPKDIQHLPQTIPGITENGRH